MLVAGESSGDLLASELVRALRVVHANRHQTQQPDESSHRPPIFFGAGGHHLADAGVELTFDLTQHAVIGLWDVLINIFKFRRLMAELVDRALSRQPDTIVCVDFSGFNRRFGHAIRQRQHEVPGWSPRLVQFVSPQVWASRPARAAKMAKDFDLLLSIFPFEKAWYAQHAPAMRVEFVGHPMIDRYGASMATNNPAVSTPSNNSTTVLLLPGSRVGELKKHLPVMVEAARRIQATATAHNDTAPINFRLVVPHESLRPLAQSLTAGLSPLSIQVGQLGQALSQSTLALASTGTVTMECAFFRLPAVTLYRTNWLTYEIGRRIVTVKSLTMPNLLANETIYPEFIQHDATPERLAAAALDFIQSPARREMVKQKLSKVIQSLGSPGACQRAAEAIANLPRPQRAG